MSEIKDGQTYTSQDGTVHHVKFDPNGKFTTSDGTKYDTIEGFQKSNPTNIPDKTSIGEFHPEVKPGDVVSPPPVPGGADTPGKGVTAVNTAAMKTYAQNLDGLVAPLKSVQEKLGTLKIRAGGFHTAQTLSKNVGGIRDATEVTLKNMVAVITEVSDAVRKMASQYETAEEVNKMSGTEYSKYLAQTGGRVNGMSGGSDGSTTG